MNHSFQMFSQAYNDYYDTILDYILYVKVLNIEQIYTTNAILCIQIPVKH